MSKIISFFVRYRIWTNVIMFSVFGFGLIFLLQMRSSLFPEVEPDMITIQVVYPGTSPEEIEEGVILKIEENLDGLPGIDQITSTSSENLGIINVKITKDASLDKMLNDVKNAVDRINSFPQDAEKPVIFEQKFRSRSLSIAISGETDLYNLKYIVDNFREDLLAAEEISQVEIVGLPRLEFSIEVSESNLRRYQLTFDDIRKAVAAANVNITGGKLDTESEEILIRAYGRRYYAKDLYNIPVRGNSDGTIIRLSDVANVLEKWEDMPEKTYYDGQNAVIVNIDQTEGEDIIAISGAAANLVEEFNLTHGKVKAKVIDDRTVVLQQRLDLLIRNGLFGLILVIAALGFFLNLRLSFWVSVGIPFSFAGMFVIIAMIGITINLISLFGMIIVVGILVDDAIVVSENIYAHYERGKTVIEAAKIGTSEVLAPVFTSVATTILAFTPFFFLDGGMGKFMWQLALVIIAALIFSLIEAFLILPSHLVHSKGMHSHKTDSVLRKKIERSISYFTNNIYAVVLKLSLQHKWITLMTPIALILMTLGLLNGGFIGQTIMPFIDGDTFPVNIALAPGSQEADVDSLLASIERQAMELNRELKEQRADGKDVIIGIHREIGRNGLGDTGSHAGMLTIQLLNGETRNMDSFVIANRLRKKTGSIPQAQKVSFGRTSMFGKPVSISLLGNDIKQLNHARDLLVLELQKFSTLRDVTDSNQEGRRELKIKLKPRAHALGLTLSEIVMQVRRGFFGQEVQRIQRGKDEIRVWVRYRSEERSSLGNLDRMRIRTKSGEYPFSELAAYSIERGISTIKHLDRRREIKVEANLVDEHTDLPLILDEINEIIIPEVLSKVQGVTVSYEGQSRDQNKFQKSIKKAFPVALLAMLIIVTLVFRSYMQAALVFSLIPLGILGAIWGHGIQGIQISMLSMFGIIALSGIVINDSIVLIDQINRNLRNKQKVVEAVYNAAISRLRPVLLTSITTAFGLGPLIFETSRQAQFLIPMAISVAYGLMFGTIILLIILPAEFLALNKFRFWLAKLQGKENITYESVEPAYKEVYEND